jgi:hypothetical protein
VRAREFLKEGPEGKLTKRQQWGTRGLHRFKDADGRDRFYELNRVMMAAAAADGVTPVEVPSASWVHNYNTAFPYTEQEDAMLRDAYRAVGSVYHDLNKGDMRSQEPPGGNAQSPIKPFRGYPR